MRIAAVLGAAGFAAATLAVRLGSFRGLDQWSVDHVMPWLSGEPHKKPFLSDLLPFTSQTPHSAIPAELWLYPASIPVTALVTVWGCATLWRRGVRLSAMAWATAWLLGNAIEVVGKATVRRPIPHLDVMQLPGFVDSFPSGHALRAILLVALLATIRPRWNRLGVAWLAIAFPLLVVTNAHLPSDVIGATLLGAGLSLACIRTTRDERPLLLAAGGVELG